MQLVNTTLWDHQTSAIERFTDEDQFLCGWEMGTGKTLFSIERDLRFRLSHGIKQTLVVAPLATHDGWKRAWKSEAPNLTVRSIDPKKRKFFYNEDAHVHIIHYEALRLMPELAGLFEHGIFDECHRLKNRNSAQTVAAKRLGIDLLTDMSGSPVTDRPHDFWSILNHLKRSEFRSFWRFFHRMTISERPLVINPKNGKLEPAKYWVTEGPSQRWIEEGLPSIAYFYDRVLARECLDL